MAFAEIPAHRPSIGLRRLERPLAGALALVLVAGVLSSVGAFFVILLYSRLIPQGATGQLALAAGGALLLVAVQAMARGCAGHLADSASQILMGRLDARGELARQRALPLIRALRSRTFLLAADLGWVPVFLLVVVALHPLFGVATVCACALLLRFGAAVESPSPRPDATFRARERRRRLGASSLRDAMQILLLSLGGAMAMAGLVQIGEIVAATLLSLRALGALAAALDDAPALRSAYTSWRISRAEDWLD